MSLRARITGAMVLLVVVTAGIFAILADRAFQHYSLPAAMTRLEGSVRNLATDLDGSVAGAGEDVLALSLLPAARGLAAGEPLDAEALAATFAAVVSAKAHYVQVRFIDVAGQERVRVDRSSRGGPPRVLREDELQSKGDRPYVAATLALPPGTLHVTPIELNEEFGEIQMPALPVLRIATPVALEDGAAGGLIIVNIDRRRAFARLRTAATRNRDLYLESEGDYLLHPTPSMEFARARGVLDGSPEPLPGLPGDVPVDTVISAVVDGGDGRFGIAATTVRLAGGPPVTIALSETVDALLTGRSTLILWLFASGIGAAAIATLLATLLAGTLARPIRAIGNAVSDFESTGNWTAPRVSGSEVNFLSAVLDRMVTSEQAQVERLEQEVRTRRAAEAALDREASQLRLLSAVVQSSADAIFSTTLDGVVTSWNPGAQWTYGYPPEEIVDRPVGTLVASDGVPDLMGLIERIGNGEAIKELEAVHLTKAGRPVTVSLTMSPVQAATGDIVGTSVIARDITDQKSLEARFRLSVEASPAGMVVVDRKGMILLVNREIERLFGYSRKELIGEPVDMLVPMSAARHHSASRESFHDDPTRRPMGSGRELFGLRKDGSEVPVEIGLNPIETPDETLVLASVVDISLRKKTLDQLRRSNAELEQFAYVASHDLQEPLRMVANYTELLRNRYEGQLDEEADIYIGFAVDGARRMQLLIADILRYSKVTTTAKPFAPADTAAIVERLVTSTLAMALHDSEGTVEVGELPVVWGDEIQLAQVFQNLIANALKFRHEEREPIVRVSAERIDRDWYFRVEDNGIGIDEQYRGRIFEMFQRLHGVGTYPGSGIGLSLARKIVERHEGRLDVESRPGDGTTFYFTMPAGPIREDGAHGTRT